MEKKGTYEKAMLESSQDEEDLKNIKIIAEQLFRSLSFRLLENLIIKKSSEGALEGTCVPREIIISSRHEYNEIMKTALDFSNGIDNWFLHKLVEETMIQADHTMNKYHDKFQQMIVQLNIKRECSLAYETFARIARKLFRTDLTWYHIISLLCFGVEIALYILQQGWPTVKHLVEDVVHFIVDFIVAEEIADWISRHGGWV